MKRRLLLAYQILTGLSDTCTGLLLLLIPASTLRLMRLHVPEITLPFVSFIGAFVLSVGLACLYGAPLLRREFALPKIGVVWLVTGVTRGVVAAFLTSMILSGHLEAGWATVASTDAVLAGVQFIGLKRGWLADALG